MINDQLTALEAADLIRLAQIEPELEYLFRHAMVQDAAYESLLRMDRKKLHHAVGHALEHLYPERRSEIAAELARHFEQGDDPAHALEYYRIAADNNAAQYALPEAVEQYCRAIELMQALRAASGETRLAQTDVLKHLYLKRGRASELLGDYPAAMEGYEDMERLAEQSGDQALLLAALMAKAIVYATGNPLHDTDKAMDAAERALEMARESGDWAAEARVLWILSLAHYYGRSDTDTATELGEEALALARQVGDKEQIAYTLGDLAMIYSLNGKLPEARAFVAETIDIWYGENNLPMVAHNLVTAARLAEIAGDLTEALRLCEDAMLIAETVGNREGVMQALIVKLTTSVNRGEIGTAMEVNRQMQLEADVFGAYGQSLRHNFPLYAYAELGLIEKTRETLKALKDSVSLKDLRPGAAGYLLMNWVRAEAAIGEPGPGTELLEEMLASGEQTQPYLQYPMLEIQLVRGEYEQALAGAEAFLKLVWWVGYRPYLWGGLRVKAKALMALGRYEDAWGVLHMAREDAEGMEAKLFLWQIHCMLSDVEEKLGHESEAEAERDSAVHYAQGIADSMDDDKMRRAFLENAVNAAL